MSIDLDRLLDVLDRAHAGQAYTADDFNLKVIPQALQKAIKKYGLAKTVDIENPVNTDDDLADRFYRAGFEAAVEIGLLCRDTHRVVRFTEQELQSAIDAAPSEFWLGEGAQSVCLRHRRPEEPASPCWTVPFSIAASEDLFVSLVEGFARIPEVDALEGPSLETVWGRPLRAGSPYEQLAVRYQADLMREGVRRAGREGMPMDASGSSFTHYGVIGGYGVPGGYRAKYDLMVNLSLADFWTSYESFHKLAQQYVTGGEHNMASTWIMLGGYAGGPESTAVACVACTLLMFAAFQSSRAGCPPYDISYMGSVGRRAQWTAGIFYQAVSRNTNTVLHGAVNQVSGPCTKALLYETLVGVSNMAVCGTSNVTGMRSCGGRRTNYLTPLEHKFGGEIYKATAGMTRQQVNELARRFIPCYEGTLKHPDDGKPFQECYDVGRLEPIPEWQRMYDEVREEALQAGVPLT